MSDQRVTDPIRCVGCGCTDAYERHWELGWELFCPNCEKRFGWDDLPKECGDCKARLRDSAELGRGLCGKCHIARWSPEKRQAMNRLIGLAFRSKPATNAEKDAAIDAAFKEL